MPLESRRKRRITIVGDVAVDDIINAKALDFSEGGMYVFIRDHFEKGKIVNVSIPFKETTINLKAVVEHIEEEMGIGLKFYDIDANQKALIKDFIDYFYSRPLETTKKRVLLADSNEKYRKSDKNRLALEGFDVFDVNNGSDLLNVLEEEKVDIVITDMFLDKMDAFKLLSLMKQTPRFKDIPVLVLSSSNNPDDIDRAASAGAIEILTKITTTPCRLSSRVKEILKV